MAKDLAKNLETAIAEMEVHFNDQVPYMTYSET